MLQSSLAFSGFTVKSLDEANDFYSNVLGLKVEDTGMGLRVHLGGDHQAFMYQKDTQVAADYTILNFPVDNIDAAVDALDAKGVLRSRQAGYGPDIAWFKDPSGNILSVLSS